MHFLGYNESMSKLRTLASEATAKLGESVTVKGWVDATRDHGGVVFIDIRDYTGKLQLVAKPEHKEVIETAYQLRGEFVISGTGIVLERSPETVNENIPTGHVEVILEELTILNASKPLPFQLDNENVGEEIRLRYRYLDLRRQKMQERLAFRHRMISMIRDYLDERGFIEVHTPILTSSSPEGARDFLVPSRIHPGEFYALPQAPQQFKQLLMVAGVPKYYQIAPCFRDEDPRADRSPGEFYQLDLEMSFIEDPEELFTEMEPMFVRLTEELAGKKVMSSPFPRIPYKQVIEEYGSDRPDLRFGMKLIELSDAFANTGFSVFASALKEQYGCIKAICLNGGANMSRSQIDALTDFVRKEGAGGLAYIQMEETGPKSPILKYFSDDELKQVIEKTGAQSGDIIFFGAGARPQVNTILGKLRSKLGDDFGLKDPNLIAWAWIVDFPMYEWSDTEKKIDFCHNPFSMPRGGIKALEEQEPLEILANQYDIIANGLELSSGALRNYNPDIMYKAFELVGYTKEQVDKRFGAMINAFSYGAPPHGGFAPGIDRLMMLFTGEPNIREVIAFPKNGEARDTMMNAPSDVDEKQLRELHIKLDLPKEK